MKKKTYEVGDIIEITWKDACRRTNETLASAVPWEASNLGKLVKETDSYFVLRTGLYKNSPDGEGDYTVIPKGWEDKIEFIARMK